MSRNLGSTGCHFCGGDVVLEEQPRAVTREDVGVHYDTHEGYGYAGAQMARAACSVCAAKYLAWVDLSACVGYGSWHRDDAQRCGDRSFFDLSFRASFNDEPDEEDLPDWRVTRVELTPEQCAALDAHSGAVIRRTPWPRCEKTGRKIYYCYGCPCAEHR